MFFVLRNQLHVFVPKAEATTHICTKSWSNSTNQNKKPGAAPIFLNDGAEGGDTEQSRFSNGMSRNKL
jgi:hypothetical protein